MHRGPFLLHPDAVGGGRPEDVENPSVQGLLAAGQAAGMVDERVVRHAEKPAPEAAFLSVVGVDLAEQLHEDVLDDVIGIELFQALLPQMSQQHRPVNAIELTPALGVLLANPDDERDESLRT